MNISNKTLGNVVYNPSTLKCDISLKNATLVQANANHNSVIVQLESKYCNFDNQANLEERVSELENEVKILRHDKNLGSIVDNVLSELDENEDDIDPNPNVKKDGTIVWHNMAIRQRLPKDVYIAICPKKKQLVVKEYVQGHTQPNAYGRWEVNVFYKDSSSSKSKNANSNSNSNNDEEKMNNNNNGSSNNSDRIQYFQFYNIRTNTYINMTDNKTIELVSTKTQNSIFQVQSAEHKVHIYMIQLFSSVQTLVSNFLSIKGKKVVIGAGNVTSNIQLESWTTPYCFDRNRFVVIRINDLKMIYEDDPSPVDGFTKFRAKPNNAGDVVRLRCPWTTNYTYLRVDENPSGSGYLLKDDGAGTGNEGKFNVIEIPPSAGGGICNEVYFQNKAHTDQYLVRDDQGFLNVGPTYETKGAASVWE